MQATKETFVELRDESLQTWIDNVYNSLIGDVRDRVLQGPTVKRHMVRQGSEWTPFGTPDTHLAMTAKDIQVGNEHIVIGYNQHKIFNWDITEPKVQVASKIGDEPSIMYYLGQDQGKLICMHRMYNSTGSLSLWTQLAPLDVAPFARILNTIDKELPPARK
jgi:hypothetical protein